jgi:hypothetical protein
MTAMSQQQSAPATAHHDDHGSTPAAWTAVIIIMLGFVAGTLGLVLDNMPMLWVGVALVPIGAVVGKVMSMMGMGKKAS